MKFRWRGGTTGFIARSASRAVRRGFSSNKGGESAINSCAFIIMLIIGIPLGFALLQLLLLPVGVLFWIIKEAPFLSAIFIGIIVFSIVTLTYLQRKGYIQSARDSLNLKFEGLLKPIDLLHKYAIIGR